MTEYINKSHEPELDISEKGVGNNSEITSLDRRTYVQFHLFTKVQSIDELVFALTKHNVCGAIYLNLSDPYGVGIVVISEDPTYFVDELRSIFQTPPFSILTHVPEKTMTGRTYAIGYERDLFDTLIKRPRTRILDPKLPWAIWYPLRRRGSFEQLSATEQRSILKEHGEIGHKFGKSQLAYDIRLDCHGLDEFDNDFIVGIVGPELTPLSKVVEHMRKTRQTSEFLDRLGPFFIGKVYWQSKQ